MTTDITELALLVSKAKASVFTLEYISQFEHADIDSDDVDLRLEVDGRDTGTNVSIVDECGQAAKAIGALVEALEKAQTERDEYRNRLKLERSILEDADKRIAELESRTVKLPALCVGVVQGGHAVMVPYAAGHWFNKTAILEMLADAGIKVEAE